MKVLWFTLTPCGANKKLNFNYLGGGWLASLEREIVKFNDIELSVCFYHKQNTPSFKQDKTTYYPVYRKGMNSKVNRFLERLFIYSNRHNNKKEIEQLLSIINKVNPDIIHIHGTEENFGLIQEYINIPVVISLQGILNPYLVKYFAGIPLHYTKRYDKLISKILIRGETFRYKKMKQQAINEIKILDSSYHIIGRTTWDERVAKVLAPNAKYHSGNEILRESFYQTKWKKTSFDKTLQLVTISSDQLYKGFETIIKTAQVLNTYPSFKFNWIVIGLDNTSNIVNIARKWLKIDLGNLNITLLGKKKETEIIDILLKSDIYCQVSHIENSPNSLCEAMLLGMPVIATNVGGTSTLLIDQKEGLLVQDGEQYSISGAIIELKEDFNKAKYYAQNAFIKASKRHNKTQISTELYEMYKDII